MIIQCDKCLTKYNLDQNLIEKRNAKVKCSRCGYVFSPLFQEQMVVDEKPESSAVEDPLVKEGQALGEEWSVEESFLDDDQLLSDDLGEELDFDEAFEEDSMESIEGLEDSYGGKELNGFSEGTAADIEVRKEQPKEESKIETVETQAPSEKEKSVSSRKPLFVLLIVLLLSGLGYAGYKWGSELFPDLLTLFSTETGEVKTIADPGGNRLEIFGSEGVFVKSPKLGRLYVIRGKVVNHYPESRSHLRVKVSILDVSGKIVIEKYVYAGNPIEDESLKTLTMEEIDKSMNNPDGIDSSNVNVEPETSVDFAVVFNSLTEDANEYEIGPVSSSPAVDKTVPES